MVSGAYRPRGSRAWSAVVATVLPVVHIEYDGIRQNLDHLAPSDQRAAVRLAELYIVAGMRPPSLSVISSGEDVTLRPDRWPAVHKHYRGPGRLEVLGALEFGGWGQG